jgi:hypothetical protein
VGAGYADVVSEGADIGQAIDRIVNVYTGSDLEVNVASLAGGGTVD